LSFTCTDGFAKTSGSCSVTTFFHWLTCTGCTLVARLDYVDRLDSLQGFLPHLRLILGVEQTTFRRHFLISFGFNDAPYPTFWGHFTV
jgi:hypothetical protein